MILTTTFMTESRNSSDFSLEFNGSPVDSNAVKAELDVLNLTSSVGGG